jgi:hypothetical protein
MDWKWVSHDTSCFDTTLPTLILLFFFFFFASAKISDTENDGQAILKALENRENRTIPQIFLGIEGPYAFVYYDASSNQIWFARDPLGRRSLMVLERVCHGLSCVLTSFLTFSTHSLIRCISQEDGPCGHLISVASHYEGQLALRSSELATDSFSYVDLNNAKNLHVLQVARGSPPITLNRQIPLESDRVSSASTRPSTLTAASARLRKSLNNSLRKRLLNISTLYR